MMEDAWSEERDGMEDAIIWGHRTNLNSSFDARDAAVDSLLHKKTDTVQ